jgi:hypothetical protein
MTRWLLSDLMKWQESWEIKSLNKRNSHQQEIIENCHKNNKILREEVTKLKNVVIDRNEKIVELEEELSETF